MSDGGGVLARLLGRLWAAGGLAEAGIADELTAPGMRSPRVTCEPLLAASQVLSHFPFATPF